MIEHFIGYHDYLDGTRSASTKASVRGEAGQRYQERVGAFVKIKKKLDRVAPTRPAAARRFCRY